MERNLIFVLILLAALSMVYAMPHQLHKRTTNFKPCTSTPPPSPLTVVLEPDPIVAGNPTTFIVSGTLAVDVPSYSVLRVEFINRNGSPIIPPSNTDFCSKEGIKCPILRGTPFSTEARFSVPTKLPDSYEIKVSINDSADPNNDLGCALAIVG